MVMARIEKHMIHGMGEVLNRDAKASPAPMALPDWNEMDTTKILMPTKVETAFPWRFLMLSINEF